MANTELTETKPRLLGISDAADYLGISRDSLRGAINDGQIASVQIGQRRKVSTVALDRLLQQAIQLPDKDHA